MKISSARAEPFATMRRRNLAEAGAKVAPPQAMDQVEFMGVTEAELTPAVRQALATLVIELNDLRSEIQRLKARLQEAETAADEDPLTSAKNRRAFIRELKRIAAFSQRYDAPASLVYFDLDDLKAVNDRFGHAAGDDLLREVAIALNSSMRGQDTVARLGGDEFCVLAPETGDSGTVRLATRVAQAVGSVTAGVDVVRACMGVAIFPEDGTTASALLEIADQRLLDAKRERSRGRVQRSAA
jgi:diguanylate cyclase (GGDEF)-like protein